MNARFELQLSAGQVFGILADNDAHDQAETIAAIAEITRHADQDQRAAWIAQEIESLDLPGVIA